jgi:pimeloyl-ACP methyl ester carboxylesterase
MNSILFKFKALIGKNLTESFYKKMSRRLNITVNKHKGSIDIEWSYIGSGKKPKVLFLHGFSDRKENFYFAAKSLCKHYDIIIPDMPGFGNSASEDNLIYDLNNYENWLSEFIEKNSFTNFHLVGNSLGGAVSATLAVKYPDRIKSLSLVDPAGFYIPEAQSIYNEALAGVNLFQIKTPEEYDDFRGRIFHNKQKLPNFVKEFMIDSATKKQEWYGKIFNELANLSPVKEGIKTIEELSLNSICKKIKMPTNILWGKHDTLFPYKTAEFLSNEIHGSQFYIFENVGHCPHLEKPREFSEKLDEFIK